MFTIPFKDATIYSITQGYHKDHKALDMVKDRVGVIRKNYGVPLVAPEHCQVTYLKGDTFTPNDESNLKRGYGIWLKGLETGHTHFYWHTLPIFPVNVGDFIQRGKIVAYMGNAGYVTRGGVYVPIERRLDDDRPGTHLHYEMYAPSWELGKKKQFVDMTPMIDWQRKPSYTNKDVLRCAAIVLGKLSKLIK